MALSSICRKQGYSYTYCYWWLTKYRITQNTRIIGFNFFSIGFMNTAMFSFQIRRNMSVNVKFMNVTLNYLYCIFVDVEKYRGNRRVSVKRRKLEFVDHGVDARRWYWQNISGSWLRQRRSQGMEGSPGGTACPKHPQTTFCTMGHIIFLLD